MANTSDPCCIHHPTRIRMVRFPYRIHSQANHVHAELLLFNNTITNSTWATRLIVKCWNIVYHLWTHRNSVLHESHALASLSGLEALRNSISAKYAVGSSSLHPVYNRYFITTLETILLRPPDQLKLWFLVIRSGHEAVHVRTPDTFSTNAALRNWIGLPPIHAFLNCYKSC